MDPSHRSRWTPVENQGILEFRNTYWGANGATLFEAMLEKPPSERFLDVRQTTIQNLFRPMLPDGLIFVRNDYILYGDRFRKARQERPSTNMRGCLLFGQPGIGKSYFLLFFLMQCLSRQESVLFTSSKGKTYLFDEHGVATVQTSNFDPEIHIPESIPDTSRLWSLVDAPNDKEPIPQSVTCSTRQLFFVAAVSPDQTRTKQILQWREVRHWWMSGWVVRELCALLRQIPRTEFAAEQWDRYQPFDADTVRTLVDDAGPCPRDVLSWLTDPSQYTKALKGALRRYDDFESVHCLLSGVGARSNEDYYVLILVSPMAPVSPDAVDNDSIIVRLKTPAIYDAMLAKVLSFTIEETRRLHACFSSLVVSRGSPAVNFGDLIFESMALRYMLAGFPLANSGTSHHQFAQMTRLPPTVGITKATSPVQFIYLHEELDVDRATIVVDTTARQIMCRPSRFSERFAMRPMMSALLEPWALRRRITFDFVDDLQAIDGVSCYCPTSGSATSSLFNAYFFQVATEFAKVVLWAVQIATKRNDNRSPSSRTGGEAGFATVVQLRERAQRAWPGVPVEVKYVLVIPRSSRAFNVEWELCVDFDRAECRGDVHVLYLDVCGVCQVEDVLGVSLPNLVDAEGPEAVTKGESGMSKSHKLGGKRALVGDDLEGEGGGSVVKKNRTRN
ncbi:hypothetical protein LXA43DRAFT_995539 [Ganoderma leucocontextum]|nr:hypothetical protein LXA43DRAFT_995539 [Ganoderma leucocontextum]